LGQYHTLDLEIQRNVTIIKDEWDSVALDRVEEACDVTKKAEIGAVVLHEGKLF
jgi:protein pelota